ncbi:MAG: VOC family protein [Chloroflexota bacterium]|nr:VOC family protein [Chloroflexota bacterium]
MIDTLQWDHVSIAAKAVGPVSELWKNLFGFRELTTFTGSSGLNGLTLEAPGDSKIALEIIEPADADSYLHSFLDGPHGPGLHHIAFQVPSIEECTDFLRSEGITPWGETIDEEGTKYAYIHPRGGGQGVLFQLYESTSAWNQAPGFLDLEISHLGITALNHVCHVTESREHTASWYKKFFGLSTHYQSPLGTNPNDADQKVQFSSHVLNWPTKQSRIEILEPHGDESFLYDFLDKRGPGLHHLTFQVSDFERALAACENYGVSVFGGREGITDGALWRETFIHPRDAFGVLVQFFWEEKPGIWV